MTPASDIALWETRHTELNTLAASIVAENDALKKEHPASIFWKHAQQSTEASMSYSSIALIYLAGFEAIFKNVPGIDAHEELRRWTKRVNRHRSAHAIASMNASAHCSALEGFLRSVADAWLDQSRIDYIRTRYSRPTRSGPPESLSRRLPAARKQLDTWLKPSGGAAFSEWLKLVSVVFRCSVPAEVRVVLEDLIMFRHAITHPDMLPDESTLDSAHGARVSSWGLAAILTSLTIVNSVVRADKHVPNK